jgi:hypothetical protein
MPPTPTWRRKVGAGGSGRSDMDFRLRVEFMAAAQNGIQSIRYSVLLSTASRPAPS